MSQQEPLGIVVQDGGQAHAVTPRIFMWFWACEEDVPDRERE